MTNTSPPGRKRPARAAAAALSLSLPLSACQSQGGAWTMDAPFAFTLSPPHTLSPQQQQLRQQSQRWNRTTLTGAAFGALAGPGVARRNLGLENREPGAHQSIEAARRISQNLEETAAATPARVTNDNRQKLAQLDRRLQSGQITTAQYRSEMRSMQQDAEVMRKTAKDARERLLASSQQVPQLLNEESKIDAAQRRLDTSASDPEAAHRAGGPSPATVQQIERRASELEATLRRFGGI